MYELLIQNGKTIYYPAVKGGVKLTWERKGMPGKLTFTVVWDDKLNITEGNAVRLSVGGEPLFFGFIFTIGNDKEKTVDVTVYDQLRYLKNKDTYLAEGIKASDLIRQIASDFRLNLGSIEDTGYTLETIVEENQTLFDIMQNALDETLLNTNKLFVLYDKVGELTLQNINSMRVGLLMDADTGENYKYESSIDSQTFDKIKLVYNDKDGGKRQVYMAQDGSHINQWGVLQYFEQIQTASGAAAKAQALLKLYNQKTRKLNIKKAFGDVRVRAGSAVMVSLKLRQDMTVNQFMVVERVTHQFDGNAHFMDLDLIGGEFVA